MRHLPRARSRRGSLYGARAQACACMSCAIMLTYALNVFWLRSLSSSPVPTDRRSVTAAPYPPPPQAHLVILPSPPSPPVPASVHIPKLIHQSWRDDGFPKGMFNWRWQQGLLDLNPGWKLIKWTDKSSRDFIAREYPWFLATYDAYPSYIQRCDASRYFIVYHHGGVYADLDIECSKPFAPVLSSHRAVFSYKSGTNMSRGLVNALFASEAKHPVWHTVFDLLTNRSKDGARAATHVEVVRSTGPGLLRQALVHHMGRVHGAGSTGAPGGQRDELSRMGVALLDSSVWHPIMPEQKRGRDASATTAAAIANSHCYHHFVSSWMTHDKGKHSATDAQRQGLDKDGRGASTGLDRGITGGPVRAGTGDGGSRAVPANVPLGQGFRVVNPWKSYKLSHAAHDGYLGGTPESDNAADDADDDATTRPVARKASSKRRAEAMPPKSFLKKAYEKRMERRRRAMGEV